MDISKLRDQVELDLVNVADPVERRRLTAFMLRTVRNRSIAEIARTMNLSVGTVHADIQWGYQNYPPAYETAEEFRRATLTQLDEMIAYLANTRIIIRTTETGDTYEETEYPSREDFIAIGRLRDQMAKLLGAYSPREITADVTVKTILELPPESQI